MSNSQKRFKLTARQASAYREAKTAVDQVGAQLATLRMHLQTVATLVLDAHGVDPAALQGELSFDDATGDLVLIAPEPVQD
jgi:hypothetical protein